MTEERKEQTVVRSFRVTEDALGRFKEIMDAEGLTQDGALKMLVSAYEMEMAKNTIQSRETEIANFQMKANELVEAFLYSLQLNQDAESRIRDEVDLQIKSKDETIIDLQGRLKAAQELATAANTAALNADNKVVEAEKALKDALERTKQAEDKARDKEALNERFASDLTKAEAKITEYPKLKTLSEEQAKEIIRLTQEIKDIQKDAEIAQERIQAEKDREIAAAKLEAEKALMILEKEKNAENQKLRDKIDVLKDEIAELKLQLVAKKEA